MTNWYCPLPFRHAYLVYKPIWTLTYLDELDRRRSTNWRSVFPYLDIHINTDNR